jgi:hypothetical protein
MGNYFSSENKKYKLNELKFIKTITLKQHLASIKDCPLKKSFLKEFPTTSNYVMETQISTRKCGLCDLDRIVFDISKNHFASNTSIENHCKVFNLTSTCVLGFSPNLIEKYNDLFKSNNIIFKSYQEVYNFHTNLDKLMYG